MEARADLEGSANCGGGDGFYWYEAAADETLISELYGPFPAREAAQAAAATQPSRRQFEAVIDNLEQKGLVESAVVNGKKRWRATET